MNISYEGIGNYSITVEMDKTVKNGYACALGSDKIAYVADDDENILGIVATVNDKYANVIVGGVVTAAYSGTAPTVGSCCLRGDGNGKVNVNAAGESYRVLSVDTTKKTVTFIL